MNFLLVKRKTKRGVTEHYYKREADWKEAGEERSDERAGTLTYNISGTSDSEELLVLSAINYINSVIFEKYFKDINTVENYYKEKYEARVNDNKQNNVGKIEGDINSKISSLPVSKELATIDRTDLLVSSNYNSFHPSAMAYLNSKWPKIETAKAIVIKASTEFCELVNSGE